MKSTKDKILNTLLNRQHATIAELADHVGINGISVRHHLINLQAEGLVAADEQRHGVGRPRFTYHLTDKGIEKFPSNYLRLTEYILRELELSYSEEQLMDFYTRIGMEIARKHRVASDSISLTEEVDLLRDKLVEEGYRITYDQEPKAISIINKNCPYHSISSSHPQICQIDHVMFANVFSKPAVPTRCIAKGDPYCVFAISES